MPWRMDEAFHHDAINHIDERIRVIRVGDDQVVWKSLLDLSQ